MRTVADDESIIGDPTEAALVVLAAKIGVDAEQTRQTLPRRAEVPFDSEYKFMATFHDVPEHLAGGIIQEPHFASVKGAPDVVIEHCDRALWHGKAIPIADVRDEILAANQQLSERGLRVLAFRRARPGRRRDGRRDRRSHGGGDRPGPGGPGRDHRSAP